MLMDKRDQGVNGHLPSIYVTLRQFLNPLEDSLAHQTHITAGEWLGKDYPPARAE